MFQCDQTQPACLNCLRRGTQCGGSQQPFKFIDQANVWAVKAARKKSRRKGVKVPQLLFQSWSPTPYSVGDGGEYEEVPCKVLVPSSLDSPLDGINSDFRRGFEFLIHTPLASYYASRPNAAYLWSLDAADMKTSMARMTYHEDALDTYVSFIPSRLGYSQALDDAAACLFRGVVGLSRIGNYLAMQECRLSYALALSTLQAALDDPTLAATTETLCAVLLLGAFEVGISNQLTILGQILTDSSVDPSWAECCCLAVSAPKNTLCPLLAFRD